MADNDPTSLTAEYLRQILQYDPETGVLIWRFRTNVPTHVNSRLAGKPAGSGHRTPRNVHRRLIIDGYKVMAHRVIWCMMTGAFPEHWIDHINGVGMDNRWRNLRTATPQQNAANRRFPAGATKGITKRSGCTDAPYVAQIRVNGKTTRLGRFATIAEGEAAYAAAAREAFGSFATVGATVAAQD